MVTAVSSLKKWIEGEWTENVRSTTSATLISRQIHPGTGNIHLARECILQVPGKFYAETALVYPAVGGNFPVYGSELIKIPSRTFSAIDFHPVNGDCNRIPAEFERFPPRTVTSSPHYDLERHFSPVLWHEKGGDEVGKLYAGEVDARLSFYLSLLSTLTPETPPGPGHFAAFDRYMARHDPARGILKAYFGSDFADDYLGQFLFPHGRHVS